MKDLNGVLHVEITDLTACGFKAENIYKGVSEKYSTLPVTKQNGNLYFPFEDLGARYKEAVEKTFGNPYEYMAKQPIKKMVVYDEKAEAFYFENGLPTEQSIALAKAASWLNMIVKMYADKKYIKKQLKLTLDVFNEAVVSLIKTEKIELPTTFRRLLYGSDCKLKEYKERGYEALIHGNTGKRNAAKIDDDISESLVLEMLCHPNQYDDTFICIQYNRWAKENNKKEVTAQTISKKRRDNEAYIIGSTEGRGALYDKYITQAKGFRPTQPTYMWESDDNHIDLLFEDPNDNTPHKYYHKYKAIVVTDSFNDYVAGYAYAENLTTDVVKAAYVNAMYNMRSVTGHWILPYETKSDRWGIKSLEPFYKQLGNYFKTPVGSKNRGYLENFFGSPLWKTCLKIGANNYSGNNMTAKYAGVNREILDLNKKQRPLIGSTADTQIENFFHRLRHMPNVQGVSKQQQWLASWEALPTEKKRIITDEQFLLKFGIVHNPQRPTSITNRGCEPTIKGVEYSYDLPDNINKLDFIGLKVNVVYDPYDMSRVLLTDFDKVRIIAKDARLNSRALEDGHTDSRTYLNSILSEKKEAIELIGERGEQRKGLLVSAGVSAEAILQAGAMDKALKQQAELEIGYARIEQNNQQNERLNFLNENNDFNDYFNN